MTNSGIKTDIPKAILLMGPTASGKTELALRLAKYYPIEVISVDSALIYRDMDIGTAKPSADELSMMPHHLINIMSPLQTYSVADFIRDSVSLVHEINARGKLPVLVGGTMMYYNGLINGISKLPPANSTIRLELEQRGLTQGWGKLHQELQQIDNRAASKIMPNDKQRIIRALEVFYVTGTPITQLQQQNKIYPGEDINFCSLAIIPTQRDVLHARIARRFDTMLQHGFIAEVENLKLDYTALTAEHTSMRSVGYAQAWEYLDEKINLTQLREAGVAATRQLAKRQITWLRSMSVTNLDTTGDLCSDSLFRQLLLQIEIFIPDKLKL